MATTVEALETIGVLYRAAVEPELWPQALDSLARACGGIGTAKIPITPGDITGLIVSPELREPNIEYERDWWQRDTRVLRIFSRKLSDGVCCEADLFTDEEVARDPMRQEFLRCYGIGAFAAHLVAPLPNFVVAFSVQRALAQGHFEKHHLETLKLLGGHAARALVISARLAAVPHLTQAITATLSQLDCAALVVDRELKVMFANAAVERLIGDGISIRQGQLLASTREHREALVRFLASVLTGQGDMADPGPVALSRPSGRRPLLVQAIPLSADMARGNAPDESAALVIIVDPERQNDYSAVRELRLLGLTPAEARLAALVGAGSTRTQAAQTLGISEWTASDTLKQVYSKLAIARQSELVRLVDRLAALRSHNGKHDKTRV